jgi:hypothetical protein
MEQASLFYRFHGEIDGQTDPFHRIEFGEHSAVLGDLDNRDPADSQPQVHENLEVADVEAGRSVISVVTRGPDDGSVTVEAWVGVLAPVESGWRCLFLGEIVASQGRLLVGSGLTGLTPLSVPVGRSVVRVDVHGERWEEVDVVRFSFPKTESVTVASPTP